MTILGTHDRPTHGAVGHELGDIHTETVGLELIPLARHIRLAAAIRIDEHRRQPHRQQRLAMTQHRSGQARSRV